MVLLDDLWGGNLISVLSLQTGKKHGVFGKKKIVYETAHTRADKRMARVHADAKGSFL